MKKSLLGLRDTPISENADESLGFGEYASAMASFVENCDTPMTIAIQGDWGSGKTSLMNMVRDHFKQNTAIKTIWFNTWQYSQFSMEGTLGFSLMSHFIDELSGGKSNSVAQKTMKLLGKVAKAGAVFAASYVSGDNDSSKAAINAAAAGDGDDPAKSIRKLKTELEQLVASQDGVERIVVFIDDLDRLVPVKAVELLENLKLFLDIPQCVFVLACDYQVVMQGLKDKFGVSDAELKGKSFFDKIIQVPFNMPLTQYRVEKYFTTLLERINLEFTDNDVRDYIALVNYSAGFNPRTMKRLFNSLLLLHLVADRKNILADVAKHASKSEISKALFAILCLQHSYEPVHRYLARHTELSDETFEKLRDPQSLMTSGEFADTRRELMVEKDEAFFQRLARFCDAFYSAVQLASDQGDGASERLSDGEVASLRKLLTFSSVVSTERSGPELDYSERYRNRDMAREFVEELNAQHKEQISGKATGLANGGYYVWQAKSTQAMDVSVCLYSTTKDVGIEFRFGPSEASGRIHTWHKRSVPALSAFVKERASNLVKDADVSKPRQEWEVFLNKYPKDWTWDKRVDLFKEIVRKTAADFLALI